MRLVLLSCLVFACACGSNEPDDEPTPVDVEGEWTAEFLVNTSATPLGGDVAQFGELSLEPATYESSSDEFVGNVTLDSVVYAPQGSIENPTLDSAGEVLVEAVGVAVYRGTWTADTYEDNTAFGLSLNCEEITITANRPDLQAVCGGPGFDASVYPDCSRPAGGTTIKCKFGVGDVVFSRQ